MNEKIILEKVALFFLPPEISIHYNSSFQIDGYGSNISIIGGADGPTSIFLAGSVGDGILFLLLIGIIGILIGMVVMKFKRNKDK